ncbi:hypothetical protein BOX15_Mlig034112g4 [Macrostomum lignano]|uniref:cyclin-dependent kinase n=2 Tax=Macrostomum lignano TaxID=282301 RepID=A0A267FUJ6_9PLAT|nr:hypothetical protein BOX15_Mlig034112g4 [Macrostomum lignano]
MEKYENLGTIGEGSYGVVMKCRRRDTGEVVAIKKFLDNEEEDKAVKKIAMREIRMLKKLKHENLVNLLEVFRRKKRLYLVFEYIDFTVLDNLERCPNGLDEKTTKKILFQVIRGVEFCHKCNTIHRDIKPENILVSRGGIVKICDFGFARSAVGENLTDYVATRWYRAPELLVGDPRYGKPVDVWAIGCLASEILTGEPLFPGDSDVDQLYHIIRCLGNLPSKYREIFQRNPLFVGMRVPESRSQEPLEKKVHKGSKMAVDLIQCCLLLDAEERYTCRHLLEHEFFQHRNFSEKFTEELRLKMRKMDGPTSSLQQQQQPQQQQKQAKQSSDGESPAREVVFTKPQPVVRHGTVGEKLSQEMPPPQPPPLQTQPPPPPQEKSGSVLGQAKKPSQIPVPIGHGKIHPVGQLHHQPLQHQPATKRHQQQRSSDELMDRTALADEAPDAEPLRRDLESREMVMPPIGQAGRLTAQSNLDDSLGTVAQFSHLTSVSPTFSPATGFQNFWAASPFGRFNESGNANSNVGGAKKQPQVSRKPPFFAGHSQQAAAAGPAGHYQHHGLAGPAGSKARPQIADLRGKPPPQQVRPLPEVRTDSKLGTYHPKTKKDPWPPSLKWK